MDTKPISVDELFQLAGIVPTEHGTTAWSEEVPCTLPGVYVITVDDADATKFKDCAPQREQQRWQSDQHIVYIGRTHCKGGLRKRLRQFRRHVYGKHSPHRGGQAILLLDCPKTIHWAVVEDDAQAEHQLIEAFQQRANRQPFGNRIRAALRSSG
jgi:hypothetical protein